MLEDKLSGFELSQIFDSIDECLEENGLEMSSRSVEDYLEVFDCCKYYANPQDCHSWRIDGNKLSDSYDDLLKKNVIKLMG